MANQDYSFSSKTPPGKDFEENKSAFLNRLGIDATKLKTKEKELIHRFCSENLHNISWYTKRIKRETRYQRFFLILTLMLLIGIPVLIFFSSEGTDDLPRSVTVLISSILAVHKFMSDLISKSRLRSLFNETSVNLKQILYALHQDYNNRATVENQPGKGFQGGYLTVEFVNALNSATFASRKIVDAETQAFFEMESSPNYDIAGLLKSGSSMTKDIISSFRNKLKVADEITGGDARTGSYANQLGKARAVSEKLNQMADEEEELVKRLNELRDIENPSQVAEEEIKSLEQKLEYLRKKLREAESESEKMA